MTETEYLRNVLKEQSLAEGSAEIEEIREQQDQVQKILSDVLSPKPTIRYGGSMAKRTMIKESYDLDITAFFPHTDERTLHVIFDETAEALEGEYLVQRKTSALRLQSKSVTSFRKDLRIDVVPGRFVDDSLTTTWLYQASNDKERLKTDLQVHVKHIRDSGVREAIRLMKLWRVRYGLTSLKTFVLELLVIDLLQGKSSSALPDQLSDVWLTFRDDAESLGVTDPANPTGNDLSPALDSAREVLRSVASSTLALLENSGWEAVFGPVEQATESSRVQSLKSAAASIITPSKPWCW